MHGREKLNIIKQALGHSYRSGGEFLFHCPFCNHHKPKLSLNVEKNVYKCWVCDASGRNIRRLVKKFGNWSLLKDKNVLYNKVKYQGKDTAVCGRYCMFFIDTTCNLKWSFKKFQDFLKEKKKENKLLSWDMLIIKLTNRIKSFTP